VTEAELQRVYARVLARRPPGAARGCVAPETMVEVAEGRASETERLGVLRHIASCGACREDFELIRSVVEAGGGLTRRSRVPMAIAAGLVALVGAGFLFTRGFAPGPMRGPASAVTLIAPAGEVSGDGPLRLVWRAHPDALRYDAEIIEEAGTPVFSTTTSDTAITAAAPLEPGREYRWWVVVVLKDGTQARSPAQRFRLRHP
jgi:hypothetical protein